MDSLNNLSQYIRYVRSDDDHATLDSSHINVGIPSKTAQPSALLPNTLEPEEEKKIKVSENDLTTHSGHFEAPDSYKTLPKRSKDQPLEYVTALDKKVAQSTFQNHILTDLLVKGSFLVFNFLMMKSLESNESDPEKEEGKK